ncbi:hypothetical protein BGZ76_009655 [Entomortierella beljakovae]|nr:hypothetical protein BGZ76_009655 [Entomortierella beljakovae]
MANQSIMVPPNNAPWPGLHTSQSQSHQPSSPYPPPPHYYHPGHPPPPPPPHSPHQQPYYPYHPYPTAPYPPYMPQHSASHPSYHPYNQSNESHEKSSSKTPATSSTTVASKDPVSSPNPSKSSPSTSIKSTKPSTATSSKSTGAKAESNDGKSNLSSSKGQNSVATPKTFRFEGSISSETYKTTKSFDLAGVNILNRKPLDTRTALDKLQRRRETHNRVERKRRDCINQLIDDLTKLLPPKHLEEVTSKCHRVNVLRGAVAHIKFLSESNAALNNSISAAKAAGFSGIDLDATQPSTETEKNDNDIDMAMEVDASESGKQDNDDDNDDDDDDDDDVNDGENSEALAESTSSRSPSPSASPRLTPSKALSRPPVIITTNSPSPSSEKDQSQSKSNLAPPPISIITVPSEPQSSEPRRQRSNSSSSFSTSPMFPPTDYMTPPGPKASAFPPSPVSPSPSSRTNPFSHKGDGAEEPQSKKDQQQLSPFTQHRSASASPALPPISTFGDIQSSTDRAASSNDRRHSEHQIPSSSVQSNPSDAATNGNTKYGSSRSSTTLPPLKIPSQQHLSPYGSHDSNQNGHRNSLAPSSQSTSTSASPRRHRAGDEQVAVSPFMLSPNPRSPSMGPVSGGSHYHHWGHEGAEAPPPPPPHYMANSLSPHAYPHGYPYPYPYHPSYGYPHPHGPPPPHHHHAHHHQHGPAPSQSAQKSSSQPNQARSHQPEPIFIQEEPWIVQRKRNTSGTGNKNQSSTSGAKSSNKKAQEKDDEETPMSPPSSVTSSASHVTSPNAKKRPSSTDDSIAKLTPGSPKRAKQLDVENDKSGDKNTKRHVDSGIIVVVEEADKESDPVNGSSNKDIEMSTESVKRVEDDADAAQTLTSLGQNTSS